MDKKENLDGLMKEAGSMLEQLFDRIPEGQQITEDNLSFETFIDKVLGEEKTTDVLDD